MNASSHPTLQKEAKQRLRLALHEATLCQEAFFAEASRIFKREIRPPRAKAPHDQLRWLNLRTLRLRFKLRDDQIVPLLLDIHRNHIKPSGFSLGVSPSVLFGPVSLGRFEERVEEAYPNSATRWAAEQRLIQIGDQFDDSDLPFELGHLAGDYRARLRKLDQASRLTARKYRRPFRDNPWRSC